MALGLLDKLFGSDDVIKKGVDGVYNGLDKLVFTDEEKTDRFDRLLVLYQPFKLIQRFLVISFCTPFILFHSIVIACEILGLQGDWSAAFDMVNGAFGYPVSAAVTLYLTGGLLEGGIKAYKKP